LVKPGELRPAYKVVRNQKFASEIFFGGELTLGNGAMHHKCLPLLEFRQTNDVSKGSSGVPSRAAIGRNRSGEFRIKQL
jgi:hypothetical protein